MRKTLRNNYSVASSAHSIANGIISKENINVNTYIRNFEIFENNYTNTKKTILDAIIHKLLENLDLNNNDKITEFKNKLQIFKNKLQVKNGKNRETTINNIDTILLHISDLKKLYNNSIKKI
jgi:hypothetical protein